MDEAGIRLVDTHVHIGPEPIARKYDAAGLQALAEREGALFVTKNHFVPTAYLVQGRDRLLGSIVLNEPAGGYNAAAVRAAASLPGRWPLFVWMPTISATTNTRPELIPPEWGRTTLPGNVPGRKLPAIDARGKVLPEVAEVLGAIAETGSVLATGHLSLAEAKAVVDAARDTGVRSIVATHPMYQPQSYPPEEVRGLSRKAMIEVAYSMNTIDGIGLGDLAGTVRLVGSARCLLSSDFGQVRSPDPAAGLREFGRRLGISGKEFGRMALENPMKLIKRAGKRA